MWRRLKGKSGCKCWMQGIDKSMPFSDDLSRVHKSCTQNHMWLESKVSLYPKLRSIPKLSICHETSSLCIYAHDILNPRLTFPAWWRKPTSKYFVTTWKQPTNVDFRNFGLTATTNFQNFRFFNINFTFAKDDAW